MKTCENCGCRLSNGICSNCNEELYILEYQVPYIDEPIKFSDEFLQKADKDYIEVQKRKELETKEVEE